MTSVAWSAVRCPTPPSVDAAIDAAVAAVAGRRGIAVSLPVRGRRRWRWHRRRRGAGRVHRAHHRSRRRARLGGPPRARAARPRREGLGDRGATEAELVDLVSAELGSDWPRLVAPSFDATQGRPDRRPLGQRPRGSRAPVDRPTGQRRHRRHLRRRRQGRRAPGDMVARPRQERGPFGARDRLRPDRAGRGGARPTAGVWSDEVAVVTGASKGSIAAAIAGKLLARRRDGRR